MEKISMMRVLITGHRGYIGSVLTGVLRHARYDVAGLDCDLFRGCDFGRVQEAVPSFNIDLRDIEFTDLLSFDAVIHLAGLAESSGSDLNHKLVEEINFEATIRLAHCCKQAQVSRFIFASSCAIYGKGGSNLLNERSDVGPLTAYASSKLRCEQELSKLADSTFTPIFMRNATVYGVSPRIRLDLVVNDFVGSGISRGRVVMKTAGRAWRPLIHVEDLARIYTSILALPDDQVHNEVINIAHTEENYRVIDIADAVTEEIPHCIRTTTEDVFDPQSYRVNGTKLVNLMPDVKFRWTLSRGIRQLRIAMLAAGITPADWRCDRFRRTPRLQSLMEQGQLSAELRSESTVAA